MGMAWAKWLAALISLLVSTLTFSRAQGVASPVATRRSSPPVAVSHRSPTSAFPPAADVPAGPPSSPYGGRAGQARKASSAPKSAGSSGHSAPTGVARQPAQGGSDAKDVGGGSPAASASSRKGSGSGAPALLAGFSVAEVKAEARWIRSVQFSDGSITEAPYPSWSPSVRIDPYLANYAALGLVRAAAVTHSTVDLSAARRWLAWYQRHEQPGTGYVADYQLSTASGSRPVSLGHEDSTDAYAGTFLLAAGAYAEVAGASRAAALLPGVVGALRAIRSTQDFDGLTWALPSYHMAYLMDVSEAYGGLEGAADFGRVVGDTSLVAQATSAASQMASGVQDVLWNEAEGDFDWAANRSGKARVDWSVFYPDGMEEAWAVGFGLATPGEAASVVAGLDAHDAVWTEPFAKALYRGATASDISSQPVGWWPIVAWALEDAGQHARADHELERFVATGQAKGWPWTFTTANMGQLIVAETGGLGAGLVASLG